ncbi:bifunctional adenosylcobinamide kinase/adenosylcobinamide-phosphate guanylyltransferase [Inquilinus sp. CAU 1745]|uniref:bifunctional adenosylcobinamide kinase/adenosylcobinamide-phosphate guanylyltransferase n=1 Tax=Inquilinus sp. CAU 1745 TaxID=3140369 RepID=UPI00325B5E48
MAGDDIAFILGGARSGKSRRAEALVAGRCASPLLIATAEPLDEEMGDRIARHRADRDPRWRTVEAPLEVAGAIDAADADGILIDCLTLWVTNLMLAGRDVETALEGLILALGRARAPVVLVANEVGLGIVPENALARRFRDEAGRVNQRIAAASGLVLFMAAGLSLPMKRPASGPWSEVR